MDRRGFLKYAGMGAAMAGCALAGYEVDRWQAGLVPAQTRTVTETAASLSTETVTRTTTSTHTVTRGTSDLELTLFADWHGDGKQQPDEPGVGDLPVEVRGVDSDFSRTIVADSDGKYWVRNVQVGKKYLIMPRTDRFKYISISNSEIRDITQGHTCQVASPDASLSVGLTEGFLTLPIMPETRYEIDRYYDRNPDPDRYLWWNGKEGPDIQPTSMKRGWSPNHSGIDYYLQEGSPLPSPAPGRVRAVVENDPGGEFVLIDHLNGFLSSCGHISEATVNRGDRVSRGQIIATSGKSGKATELANYPHNHFQVVFNENVLVDTYGPTFEMAQQYSGYYLWTTTPFPWISTPVDSNPNMANHWTKNNDPQYAMI